MSSEIRFSKASGGPIAQGVPSDGESASDWPSKACPTVLAVGGLNSPELSNSAGGQKAAGTRLQTLWL